ncbi:pyroglutamyl-peptidase I [Sneathiella marina]|uniref:Pyrrolidone-carboxylate peptidase n=1 Tax=Sneathiella marina TaxID=2950108 RepID=A0ABY4W460_9PROT|nr:pyroglutamyl-peptidase I [Sneathiella marina]USG61980.1 pyroglutamyl-peptidase I [Sneathiella marina]
MKKILVTGFEAFGNTPVNPAELVARELDGSGVGDILIVSRVIPNTFFKCIDVVQQAIKEEQPEAVVMLGEFGGRSMLTVERIAQNMNDGARYGLRDNAGQELQGDLTVPDGPVAYYATLPIRAMVLAMREAGIPADISDAAGTFCCNHLMYGILHHIAEKNLQVRAGWIHIPHLPEVAALDDNLGAPSMSLATSVDGVRAGIRAICTNTEDCDTPFASRFQI